ncbi:MAG TPA: site-specific integrase, partial [Vicinamibacteria bacterium]|nr:site-specific integrase [Vicinamibacteria bacterium]
MAGRYRAEPLTAPAAPRGIERDYLDHLRVERGCSPNTLDAYGRDVARLRAFADRHGRDV